MKTVRRFLVMLLVLAQLMMITYGAMPETVAADEAQLMCIWADWPDGENGWKTDENESLQAGISGLLGRTWMLVFYYGTETNPGDPIKREKLSFPDFVTAAVTEYVAEGYEQAVIELTFTGTGSDYITYKVDDNTTVQLPITVTLPGAGLYSSTTASDETYLLSATWTGDETYYIVPAGAYSDYQITSIEPESIPSYLNVEVSDDGEYATVTVNAAEYDAQMPNGWVQMKVNMQHETNSVLEWCGFQLIDGRNTEGGVPDSGDTDSGNTDEAQLMYVWAGDGYPSIENADSFYKNLTEWVGLRDYYAFFCGDTNDYGEAIDLANLSFPDFVRVTEVKGVNEDYKGKILCIEFVKCGSGYISYTVDGKPIAQMPISVTLPPVGLYSETTASESSYLGIDITWTGEETYNICLAPEYSDWTITRITDLPEYMRVEYKGTYAVLTIDNETFTEQSWVSFRVYRQQNGEEGKEYFNGVGFSLTDGRTEETLPVVGIYSSAEPSVESYLGGNFDYIGERHGMFRICLSPKYSSYSIQKIEFVSQPEYLWVDEINGIYANLMIDAEVYDQKASNCDLVEARVYLRDQSTPFICSFMITDARSGEGSSEDNQPEEMLPVVGIYSSAEPSADSYLGTDIKWTGKETYYIAPAGDWADYKITSVDFVPSYLNVEVSDDGEYATITINAEEYDAQMPDGWIELQVNVQHKTEANETNWTWCSFRITDGRAGLMAVWSGNGYPDFENNNIRKHFSETLGNSREYVFLFGTVGLHDEAIALTDLIFPNFVKVTMSDSATGEYAGKIFRLEFVACGSGYITYEVEGEVVAQMPITVSLPDIALHSSIERSIDTYVKDQTLAGDIGEVVTGWILWDPEENSNYDEISLWLSHANHEEIRTTISTTEPTSFEEYGVTFTPYLESGRIRVDYCVGVRLIFSIDVRGNINYQTDNIYLYSSVVAIRWADKSLGTVYYQDKLYTVGFGETTWNNVFILSSSHVNFGDESVGVKDLDYTLMVGAFKDYNTSNAQPADADFYDCIESVETTVLDWYNLDGGSQAKWNGSLGNVYDYPFIYGKTKALKLTAEADAGFVALLNTTITFRERNGKEQTTSFQTEVMYVPNSEELIGEQCLTVDLSSADTSEKLNAVLKNTAAFSEWLEVNYAEELAELRDAQILNEALGISGNSSVFIDVELPAVTYENIIVCGVMNPGGGVKIGGVWCQFSGIYGTEEDGKQTVMPGLKAVGDGYGGFSYSFILFCADEDCKMTYGDESFTCGILADTTGWGSSLGSIGVYGCTFEGFDYGLRGGADCIAVDRGNRFINCKVGWLLDGAIATYPDNSLDPTTGSTYINCDTAIKVIGLPLNVSPYYFRVNNCDFINNGCDFDVTAPGVFYFYANYYGALLPDVEMPTSSLDMVYRLPIIRGEDEDTLVVTNPRYAFAISYPSDALGNFLVVDLLRPLIVINGEAGNLVFDSNDFSEKLEEAEEDCEIVIVDEKEEQKGKWKFDKDKKKDKDKDKQ